MITVTLHEQSLRSDRAVVGWPPQMVPLKLARFYRQFENKWETVIPAK